MGYLTGGQKLTITYSGRRADDLSQATHVEFGNTRMVVTYACNSQLKKTVANEEIYVPRVVVLDVPKP